MSRDICDRLATESQCDILWQVGIWESVCESRHMESQDFFVWYCFAHFTNPQENPLHIMYFCTFHTYL